MINFSIPGMYEQKNLMFKFLEVFRNNPEFFNDDVDIEAVYGNFQFCIWDGGRIFQQYRQTTKEEIEDTVRRYNQDFNVPIRLIFTNNQLTQDDFNNRFCNVVLEICHNKLNQITIADENLRQYILKNYPDYTFISSTTKCITNPQDLITELDNENFKEICIDYNLNHNFSLLESLPEEKKNKVELLCNAICPEGCQYRKEHYRLNSLFCRSYGHDYIIPECGITTTCSNPKHWKTNKNFITFTEIRDKYEPLSYSHFKLEGRTFEESELLANLCLYMVKPEYMPYIMSIILKK